MAGSLTFPKLLCVCSPTHVIMLLEELWAGWGGLLWVAWREDCVDSEHQTSRWFSCVGQSKLLLPAPHPSYFGYSLLFKGSLVSQMRRNSGQCSWCDNLGRGTFSGLLRPWSWFPGEIIPGIQCFTRGSNCQLHKQIEVNFWILVTSCWARICQWME